MKWLPTIITLLIICSCSKKPAASVISIGFINNKQSIIISGFDNSVVQQIARDSSFQSLLPVYRMPADTDMKNYQPVQPGRYIINNNRIIFTPDTPFAIQQIYFLRYHKFDNINNAADFLSGHNKPGRLPYTDLIFKQ